MSIDLAAPASAEPRECGEVTASRIRAQQMDSNRAALHSHKRSSLSNSATAAITL